MAKRRHPCKDCKQANSEQPRCPHSVLMAVYPEHCQSLRRMTVWDAWAILRTTPDANH